MRAAAWIQKWHRGKRTSEEKESSFTKGKGYLPLSVVEPSFRDASFASGFWSAGLLYGPTRSVVFIAARVTRDRPHTTHMHVWYPFIDDFIHTETKHTCVFV
jgi:hypothetical protein